MQRTKLIPGTRPSSAIPYPIPSYLVPLNIFYYMYVGYHFYKATVNGIPELLTLRKAAHPSTPAPIPLFAIRDIPVLTHSLPEIDFPMVSHPQVVFCGPIVRPDAPLADSDPELHSWVRTEGRKTLVINLGSHRQYTDTDVVEMAAALRTLMERDETVQVLWKLKPTADATWELGNILADEVAQGRVKVVSWIKPSMVTLLAEDGIVCFVNHGGANNWHEGIA